MHEIPGEQFERVLPLLAGGDWRPVLPEAVCERINPGRVFVDRADAPSSAWIWLACGYFYLCGQPPADAAQSLADQMNADLVQAWAAVGERGLVLAPLSAGWQAVLEGFLAGKHYAPIYRREYRLNPGRFRPSAAPPGFRLRRMDADLLARLGGMTTWRSPADFLAHGLGFCLLDGEEIAAHCASVFASRTRVEIDVHTAEGCRRRGLAHAAASALVKACLEEGREPNWECFWNNEPSNALAGSLGFEKCADHAAFYWEPENKQG
ncbi:GNAT acetyltransferase [Longilinea arvoryzae]|uniref:GNAT acetyltransferase n=1 Tax=Longilinea arvoryzae TaxID=360412 RepID=A0A0S7BET0_9CHLR|nr:GNAT family N-acetyltransferase [Longilinea arvoryzae]GAP12552.1 GNAT acetyltransferase [Longilinea arvoryzae]